MKYSSPLRTVLSARLKSNPLIAQLKIRKSALFREVKTESDIERRKLLKAELKGVSTNLKRVTRRAITEFRREQVQEIESLEIEDCKRMWKELKSLCSWNRKVTVPGVVLNEMKEEAYGEKILDVWKRAFQARRGRHEV